MKKTLLILLLALGMTLSFAACGTSNGSGGQSSDITGGSSGEEIEDVCTIVFKQTGYADIIKTLDKGETLTDIPNPIQKVGYTIIWDRTDFSNVTENLVVNAIETPNTYTITFDASGGTIETETQEVIYDAETTFATPKKADYLFLGWTYNGRAIVNGAKWEIADNVTLVATWQDNRPTYTVKFVDGTKLTDITVKKGESIAEADVPNFVGKTGYSVRWDKTDYTNIQSDMTVTAEYKPNVYTVTYEAEGYEIDGSTTVLTFDDLCDALDMSLTKEGYNFLGWKYGNATYTKNSTWNIADDVILTADWSAKDQVVVTFINANGSAINKTAYKGEALTDIPRPQEKVGYIVDTENWYVDEECTTIASFADLQNNISVYAKAIAKTYTVSYNANGGVVSKETQTMTYNAEYALEVPTHEKSYMRFDGWKDAEGNTVAMSGDWTIDNGISLTAQWVDAREIFTISFVQAGQVTKTFTVKEGEAFIDIPEVVERTGYNVNWDEKSLAKLSNVVENVEVVAIETVKTYTIRLNANGGSVSQSSIEVVYGKAYQLLLPSKNNYTFEYWTYEGKIISMNGVWDIDAENIELVAIWVENNWTDNF